MTVETSMGPGGTRFPSTIWEDLSRIREGRDKDRLNTLAERYWRPIYKFIRAVWKKPVEDAKDLTQEFFASIFDEDFLKAADQERGSFRKFLLASLRNFLTGQHRMTEAQKRGAGRIAFSLDAEGEDLSDLRSDDLTPETAFDRAWAAEILRRAEERLQAEYAAAGRSGRFEVFRRYCLADDGKESSYLDVGRELGLTENDVRHALVDARARFRALCEQIVQESVRDPGQMDDEMTALFGRWS